MIGRMAVFIVTVAAAIIVVNFVARTITHQHEGSAWAGGLQYDLGIEPLSKAA